MLSRRALNATAAAGVLAGLLPHAERVQLFAAAGGTDGGEAAVRGGGSELRVKEPT